MMNVVAMILILTTIAATAVFSPQTDKMNSRERRGAGRDDVIIKEGHRVIVIEYEREEANRNHKPESTPPPPPPSSASSASSSPSSASSATQKPFEFEQNGISSVSSLVGNANEKFKEACSVLPNLGHGISGETVSEACQKSKEVMDEALDKASKLTSYKAHLVEEGAKGVKYTAVETGKKVSDKAHDFKEAFEDARDKVSEKTHGFRSSATEAANKMKEKMRDKTQWEEEAYEQVRDSVKEKAHDLSEGVKESVKEFPGTRGFGEGVREAKESVQRIPERIGNAKERVLEKTHDLKEAVEDATESVTEKAKRIPLMAGKAKWRSLDKAHELKEAAEETGRRVAETFSDAKDKATEKIEDVAETTKKRVPETVSNAKETVLEKTRDLKGASEDVAGVVKETATKTIPESLNQAKEKVSGKTHEMKETIEESAREAPKKVYEGFNKAKETIEESAREAPKKVSEGFNKAKETIKTMPENVGMAKEKVSEKAHEFKEAIGEAAEEAPNKVSEGFDMAKEAVKRVPESIGLASEKVSEKARELKDEAPGKVSEGLRNLKGKVVKKASELKGGPKSKQETAAERAKRVAENLRQRFSIARMAVTDDRTKHQKTTHFLIEGNRNFTDVFWKSWESVTGASDETVNLIVGVFRMIGFGTAYGGCVWVTFVSSHLLKKTLPRQQYAMVQSKIYPIYFRVLAYSLGTAILGHLVTKHHHKSSPSEKFHGLDLMTALGFVLVNLLFLEPRATKITPEGLERTEAEEDRGKRQAELERLNTRLQKLNTYSAFFNILTLMTLTFHLVFLSECLYVSC